MRGDYNLGIFGRKSPSKEGVHTDKGLSFLCNRAIRYAAVRIDGENGETVVGREGYINLTGGRVIICCSGKTVFDSELDGVIVGELMSHNGATFTYRDELDGKKKILTAYYTSYVK